MCIKTMESVGNMAEILARTFIIAFVLVYSGVFLALVGWSIGRALRDRLRKTGMTKVLKHFQRLAFLHHTRGD
jgi:hypothetical protein